MNYLPEDEEIPNDNNDSGFVPGDLPDSPEDEKKLRSETVIMELPEVKDIPGQEHIHVMPMGELADTTISSADEEGAGIEGFEDEDYTGDTGDIPDAGGKEV